jgi:hypothetical protein
MTGAATETTLSGLNTKVTTTANGIKVDGTATTQPVSAVALPLPSGASTSALQTTGNSSLSSIDGKTPALGQALAAASVPVVLPAAQITTLTPPTSVGVNNFPSTQAVSIATMPTTPVTGTFWQATQPVSLASSVPVTDNAGSLTVDAPVGTPVFVRLSDGVAAIATLPVSTASLPLPSGAATAALQTQPGVDIGDVTINNASGASAVNVQDGGNSLTVDGTVTITPPTLTKGTQGGTGLSVQDLKDAGRTAKRYYAVAAAAGATTTETAITLTHSSQDSATTTGTSFTPTNGKTFRITAIVFATRGNATATVQTTTFNLRMNTAGAVTTTSTPVLLSVRSATPATASAWDRFVVEIPDGIEISGDGTKQWGVTAAATYVTNAPTWDVTIIGFEY